MSKNERTRTMVYSNVNKNKKADKKSASKNDNVINLDNETVIGLARFPEPKLPKEKKNKDKNRNKNKNSQLPVVKNKTVNTKAQNIKQKIKKQKIRAINRMITCLFLIFLLIGGGIYFLLSPVFNIKTIEVINNVNIPKDRIINSSEIVLNENMFKFSKKEAENKILSNPYIESVDIKRKFFDKIQINITERQATLMLEYGNSYVYINNQGYILEITSAKLESIVLTGYVTPLDQIKPGNRLSKDDLERLETVLNIIETANNNDLGGLITKIDIKNKKDYKVTIESEDKVIYLGECSDLSTQMLFVKKMLEYEKGIEGEFFVDMDLNTGKPVFREKV